MIQCYIHLAGTPQSYYPAFFESALHNDVSQQGKGTWPRPPDSFCWNDLSFFFFFQTYNRHIVVLSPVLKSSCKALSRFFTPPEFCYVLVGCQGIAVCSLRYLKGFLAHCNVVTMVLFTSKSV